MSLPHQSPKSSPLTPKAAEASPPPGWVFPPPGGKGPPQGDAPAWTADEWATWYAQHSPGLWTQTQQPPPDQSQQLTQLLHGLVQSQQVMAQHVAFPKASTQPRDLSNKQISTPDLPDPSSTPFVVWERAVQEFQVEVAGYPEYKVVKAIKDSLPVNLQILASDRMSVLEMQQPDAVVTLIAWIRGRYADLPGTASQEALENFDKFRRTTPDLRAYLDAFETHLVRLSKHGTTFNDEQVKQYIVAKADLPALVKNELMLSLHRTCKATNVPSASLQDLKDELLLLGKRPDLFVRRQSNVNVIASDTPHDVERSRTWDRGSSARGREPSRHDRGEPSTACYYTDKGKGKGKGKDYRSKPPCRHHARGHCHFGDSCRFSHSGKGGDRSRSRSHGGYQKNDRSRSPRGRGGYEQNNRSRSRGRQEPCRDFARGQCRRGGTCLFLHEQGHGLVPEAAGRSSSRSPRNARSSPSGPRRFGKGNTPPPRFGGFAARRGSSSRSPTPR